MAQLVVMAVDRTSSDVYVDVKVHKRGDVIDVLADDVVFSPNELSHPEWRILKFDGVSRSEASVFLSPELPTAPPALSHLPDPMLQVRGFYLDLDAATLPAAMKAYLADATRAVGVYTVPASVNMAALKRKRLPRPDPFVIG